MMSRMTAFGALALLAACGSASVVENGASAQASSAAKPLVIAGVSIGMSATAARAALARDGWNVEAFPGLDWATAVRKEVVRQRNLPVYDFPRRGMESLRATKEDETIVVEFHPVASGAKVSKVAYSAPTAGRTKEQLRAQLVERYGMPTRSAPPQSNLLMDWCTGGEKCRSAYGAAKPAMHAEEDSYRKLQLLLLEGVDAERAWQEELQSAVGREMPAKSSF